MKMSPVWLLAPAVSTVTGGGALGCCVAAAPAGPAPAATNGTAAAMIAAAAATVRRDRFRPLSTGTPEASMIPLPLPWPSGIDDTTRNSGAGQGQPRQFTTFPIDKHINVREASRAHRRDVRSSAWADKTTI